MSDQRSETAEALHWQQKPAVYVTILVLGLVGVLAKMQFGKFLIHAMGKSSPGPQTPVQWLLSEWGLLGIAAVACLVHRYSGLPSDPWLARLYSREARLQPKPIVWRPAIFGALINVAFQILSQIYQTFSGTPTLAAAKMGTLSKSVLMTLAMLYPLALIGAPLSEEVEFRFGIMSLIMAALVGVGGRKSNGAAAFWIANIVQAACFGFVHVQQGIVASQAGGLLFQTAIAPQTYAGLVLGYVFRRWGLGAAVIAHLLTDILAPLCAILWGVAMHHH